MPGVIFEAFSILSSEPLLHGLVRRAFELAEEDPSAAAVKLRKYGELVSRRIAQEWRFVDLDFESHAAFLDGLSRHRPQCRAQVDCLHRLRISGNRGAHEEGVTTPREVSARLTDALAIARWYADELGLSAPEPISCHTEAGGSGSVEQPSPASSSSPGTSEAHPKTEAGRPIIARVFAIPLGVWAFLKDRIQAVQEIKFKNYEEENEEDEEERIY